MIAESENSEDDEDDSDNQEFEDALSEEEVIVASSGKKLLISSETESESESEESDHSGEVITIESNDEGGVDSDLLTDDESEHQDEESVILASNPSSPVKSRYNFTGRKEDSDPASLTRSYSSEGKKSASKLENSVTLNAEPGSTSPVPSKVDLKPKEDSPVDKVQSSGSVKEKMYSPESVVNLQNRLLKQKRIIEQNEKLLNRAPHLPDNGAKLKEFISTQRGIMRSLQEEMARAIHNVSSGPENGNDSVEEVSPEGGRVVISDEQKLDMMYVKMKNLNHQLALARSPGDQERFRKQRDQLSKQILSLEPFVKQKNPYYRPLASKTQWVSNSGRCKLNFFFDETLTVKHRRGS